MGYIANEFGCFKFFHWEKIRLKTYRHGIIFDMHELKVSPKLTFFLNTSF